MYDRIIDLRIATPQIIINYAMFLEEHNYFEESFKVMTADLVFLSKVRNDCSNNATFEFLGVRAWHCSLQVAQCVRHLEHLPDKVH